MPRPDLFEFTSDLEAPVGVTGLADDLLRDMLERRAAIVAKLCTGACKSMESYAEAVGGIRQIDWVLGFADRKRKDLERELGTPITNDED